MMPDALLLPQHVCSVPCDEGGAKLAVRWILEGHHLGYGWLGAPTGHHIRVLGFTHFHVVGDRIVDEWVVYDELSMLTQVKLGALAAA